MTQTEQFAAAMAADGMVMGFDVVHDGRETRVVYAKLATYTSKTTRVTEVRFNGYDSRKAAIAFLEDVKALVPVYAKEDIDETITELFLV